MRDAAVARLHALLLRAARFEVARRRPSLPHLRGNTLDDLAHEAADDALVCVLARLGEFRGASRFKTWAYKLALLEAAVKLAPAALAGARGAAPGGGLAMFASAGLGRGRRPSRAELWPRCATRSPTC